MPSRIEEIYVGVTKSSIEQPCFDVEEVLQEATMVEKVALLAGSDFWHTTPLERFNVPKIRVSDGPNGIRGTNFFECVPAACIPCGTGLAATWDSDLIFKAGVLIGQECKAKGVHCWLGPTVNIPRSPLGGRGFESLSEDPYLSGKLAGFYINGTQSTGVIATIKHFVANDQEHERNAVDVLVNKRAMREIYLLPFQIAIGDSQPGSVMTAYNKVNGVHVSESKELLDILLKEWGWKGMVMSDWMGTYSTSESLIAGLDLEMPGPTRWRGGIADLAVMTRKVSPEVIDERARNVLQFVQRASMIKGVSMIEGVRDLPEDRILNRKLAGDSVVLLKNDRDILPLSSDDITDIALIGPALKTVALCGGGSASLEPYYTVSPYQAIIDRLPRSASIHYEVGSHNHAFLPTLSSNLRTIEGELGARMRFYIHPPSIADREIIYETVIPDSSFNLAGFQHDHLGSLYFADMEGLFTPPETGDYEFGLTAFGSANLYIDDVLVIENTTKQRFGHWYFGKGTMEERAVVHMVGGQDYRVKMEFGSAATSKVIKPGAVSYGGGAGRLGVIQLIDEEESIARSVKLAKEHKYTIVCVGLTGDWESEGYDRTNFNLPGSSDRLIAAVLEANPEAVIITQSGSPIAMPWVDAATTLVHSWYGGNEVGNGIADVVFGQINPSAKLPVSFPRDIRDTPSYLNFGSERGRVVYGESVYVGYRYYEKVGRDVMFPFGHGLSYTTFTFSDLQIENNLVTLKVTNTGRRAGAEVIQLYIAANEQTSSIQRAKKELKGFSKTFLQPGETKMVNILLDKFAFAFWDELLNCWVNEKGKYQVLVGRSSQDILLEGVYDVTKTTTWRGL